MGTASVVEQIVAEIRQQVLDDRLRPGTTLPPEREFAGQLGVSRATLREALSVLEQMGLLTVRRGRGGGATVCSPTPTTVSASVELLLRTKGVTALDLTEFRRGLELETVRLASERRTDAAVQQIERALRMYLASVGGPEENVAGRTFHYAIALAAGNPLLAETMLAINDVFAECFGLEMASSPLRTRDETDRLHRPILEAIRQRDPERGRRAMEAHFDHLQAVLGSLGLASRELGSPVRPRFDPEGPLESNATCGARGGAHG